MLLRCLRRAGATSTELDLDGAMHDSYDLRVPKLYFAALFYYGFYRIRRPLSRA